MVHICWYFSRFSGEWKPAPKNMFSLVLISIQKFSNNPGSYTYVNGDKSHLKETLFGRFDDSAAKTMQWWNAL